MGEPIEHGANWMEGREVIWMIRAVCTYICLQKQVLVSRLVFVMPFDYLLFKLPWSEPLVAWRMRNFLSRRSYTPRNQRQCLCSTGFVLPKHLFLLAPTLHLLFFSLWCRHIGWVTHLYLGSVKYVWRWETKQVLGAGIASVLPRSAYMKIAMSQRKQLWNKQS